MAENILSFLALSFTMSAIILFVIAFNSLSGKWLQARLRYAVWLVVLVGLIIPLRPAFGDGLFTIPVSTRTTVESVAPQGASPNIPAVSTQNAVVQNSQSNYEFTPAFIILFMWATIAFAIFAYHVSRYNKFISVVQRWGKPVEDAETLKLYQDIMREKGLENKKIPLIRCNLVSTSMLTGFLNPIIILPDKQFTTDELEMIFRHELIHHKRGDLYIKLLSAIAISIHWFNPVVYLMCSAIQTECEASCDEAVLLEMGEASKLFYAELIVEMVGKKRTATMLSTCFYGGKKSLKRRLGSIMEDTSRARKPAYAGLLLIIMMSMMSGSVFAFSLVEIPPQNIASSVEFNFDVTDRSVRPVNPPVTFYRAVEIAMAHAGEGAWLDEVSMDFERGMWVWEIEFGFDCGSEVEIYVDIITGEVLRIK